MDRRSLVAVLILSSLVLVSGEVQAQSKPGLGTFPAVFEGELPCADCPGIFYHLDLFEDRMFFLRTTYLGRGTGAIRDVIGSWVLDSVSGRFTLFGGNEAPIFFRIIDSDTIRKLDVEGRDIESKLNYEMRRKDGIPTIEPRLNMQGMYQYMADAALFTECQSGKQFPVASEGDNLALQRAYLEARQQPGEQLMVSLTGRLAARPKMEGDGVELVVIPERFGAVWPGKTCGIQTPKAELYDTYWKLTRLGDEPVMVGTPQNEPHLVLRSEEQRIAGFGGCNRISSTYTVDGDSIEFGPIASTMMACAEGAETERAFLAALENVRSWRLIGEHLDFLVEEGGLAARFEARLEE